MRNQDTFPGRLGVVLAMVLLAMAGSANAAVWIFSTTGNWDVNANWTGGAAPWTTATAVPADDVSLAANMTVNTSPTYTDAGNPNFGNAFQVRRVGMQGGRTMTIVDGGTFDFSGRADSKIDLTNTGSTLIMTGGTLTATRSNLGGVNIAGTNALCQIGGSSTVNISDPFAGYSPGFNFGTTDVNRTLHVIGSGATINVEGLNLGISSNVATNANIQFTLDAGGASAINVTDLFDMQYADNLTLNLQNPGTAFTGSSVMLFDLTSGSNDTFDSVVTAVGVYAGAEGTQIQLTEGGPIYTLTYQFGDGDDIGLIPEPASLSALLIGATLLYRKRR